MQFNRSGPRRTKYAPPEKTRIKTAPKAKAPIDIEIEDFINIPGIGDMSMPKPKAKVKPKPKAKAKAKTKPKPKADPQKELNRLSDYIKKAIRNKSRSRGARKKQWSKNLINAQNKLKGLRRTIQKDAGITVKNPGGTGPVYRDSKGKPKKAPRTLAEKKLPKPAPKPAPKPKAKVKAKPRPPAMPPMMGTGDYGSDFGPTGPINIPRTPPAPKPTPVLPPVEDTTPAPEPPPTPDDSSTFKFPKLSGDFSGEEGSGMVSHSTTVFDRYDPETDTYHGSIGGVAGNIPHSVKGSEVTEEFKKNWAIAQKGYKPVTELPPSAPPPFTPPPPIPGGGEAPYRTHQFIDENGNGIDDRDEPAEPPPGSGTTPPPSTPPAPPPLVKVDPFKGFSPSYTPEGIVGQSFDPSVREDYEKQMQEARARMMQPGGNIAQNPTYQTPTMAVPQTQFGGYGQPMPIAPLLPYSGLAAPRQPFVPFSPESKD